MSEDKELNFSYDPNNVMFGGTIQQITIGTNKSGTPKTTAIVHCRSARGQSFDTKVVVIGHGTPGDKLRELYESKSYCWVQGRLASDKSRRVWIIPSHVFDGGAE